MSRLDYSRLIHSKEQPVKGYSRKGSFYLQGDSIRVRYLGGAHNGGYPFTKEENNMSKIDYFRLKHSKEQLVRGYSRKESFYMQKGNGRVKIYSGDYDGDVSVFEATHRMFIEDLVEKARKSSQDDNRIFSNKEKELECDRVENSDINIEVK